ncbi:MAG: hypothetical protein QF596_09680 [Acidimicrobiales bacterium]|jgi:hypothetical protein|nr:hypothetical protein [Acidimicrobiales bacterium]
MSDVKSVNKKVKEFLCDRWNGSKGDEENSWVVNYESVSIYLRIREIDWFTDDWDSTVIVELSSIILFDVECSNELFEHIARTNGDSLFGAIFATASSWNETKGYCDLVMNHRLMGNHLTKDELNLSIVALGVVMEEFRKEYLEMFGGTPVNDVDIFGDENGD